MLFNELVFLWEGTMKKIISLTLVLLLVCFNLPVNAQENSTELELEHFKVKITQISTSEDDFSHAAWYTLEIFDIAGDSGGFLLRTKSADYRSWDELDRTDNFVDADEIGVASFNGLDFQSTIEKYDKKLFYKINDVFYSYDVDINFETIEFSNHQIINSEEYPNMELDFVYYGYEEHYRDNFNREYKDGKLANIFADYLIIDENSYVQYKEDIQGNNNTYIRSEMWFDGYDSEVYWFEDNRVAIQMYFPHKSDTDVYKVELDSGEVDYILVFEDFRGVLDNKKTDAINLFIQSEDPHLQEGNVTVTSYKFDGTYLRESTINFHQKPFAPQVMAGGEGSLAGYLPKVNGEFVKEMQVIYPDGTSEIYESKDGNFAVKFDLPEFTEEHFKLKIEFLLKHPETGLTVRSTYRMDGTFDLSLYDTQFLSSIVDDVKSIDLDKFTEESVKRLNEATENAEEMLGNSEIVFYASAPRPQEVYDSIISLNAAIENMVLRSGNEGVNPTPPIVDEDDKNTTPPVVDVEKPTDNTGDKKDPKPETLPETGMSGVNSLYSFAFIALGSIIVLFETYRKNKYKNSL